MTYEDFKDITRGTNFDKILRGEAFNIPINPFNTPSMVYNFFNKKLLLEQIKNENLFLLKDLLEPQRTKFMILRLQYPKICIFIN